MVPVAALLTVLSACDGADPVACSQEEMPAVSGQVLFVSQGCGSSSGDGSRAKPYQTISAATEQAKAGSTIAVAGGVYAETVQLPAGVSLRGVSRTKVTIAPSTGYGLVVDQPGDVTVATLTVRGATGVGLLVKQVATASRCSRPTS
jgi:pectin methylesterase-like acyl-CoA thioesterase